MIESLQGGYRAQAVNTYTAQTERREETVRQSASGDSVSLSDKGRLMSNFFSSLGVDYTPGKPLTLDALEAGLEQKQDALETGIKAMFLENGISTTPPVDLTSDEDGAIRVSGDHPQKEEIEALFEANPDLANDFRGVAMLSSVVEAGREFNEARTAEANNPYATAAQYFGQLPGQTDDDFVLTISGTVAGETTDDAASEGVTDKAGSSEATTASSVTASTASTASAAPDFTKMTRQELMDWVNGELKSGRMTFEESAAFIPMTIKISAESNQPVDMASDTERYDFIEMAKNAIEGALWFGDSENAARYQNTLNIMQG
ncbi:hypothetical protein [Pseudodesulfovibrio sp.]|uniref:hypothetical protein n=1 Tax=unclassified Pseudodesulfovibrio TaxID=2661612 RepID=UPI003B000EE9